MRCKGMDGFDLAVCFEWARKRALEISLPCYRLIHTVGTFHVDFSNLDCENAADPEWML